jgi:hypothetical protein
MFGFDERTVCWDAVGRSWSRALTGELNGRSWLDALKEVAGVNVGVSKSDAVNEESTFHV